MTTREEEIRALLEQAQGRSTRSIKGGLSRTLSRTWEAVMQAHDNTTAATTLREADLLREFYLLALEDIAQAVDALEEGRRQISTVLVNDLNIARYTAAEAAGVSRTKMSKWLDDQERSDS